MDMKHGDLGGKVKLTLAVCPQLKTVHVQIYLLNWRNNVHGTCSKVASIDLARKSNLKVLDVETCHSFVFGRLSFH